MVDHWDEVGNGSFQEISIVLTPEFQQEFYAFFSSKSICYDISEVEAIEKGMFFFLEKSCLSSATVGCFHWLYQSIEQTFYRKYCLMCLSSNVDTNLKFENGFYSFLWAKQMLLFVFVISPMSDCFTNACDWQGSPNSCRVPDCEFMSGIRGNLWVKKSICFWCNVVAQSDNQLFWWKMLSCSCLLPVLLLFKIDP